MNYDFENFKKTAIIRHLSLDNYKYLQENLDNCDISSDTTFQIKFNAFYKVRRNEKWRKTFYTYFEKIKNNKNIKFDEILQYIYDKTGNIEASFASKVLSTINPNMPIWDQNVLENLGLKEVTGSTKEARLEKTKKLYTQIISIENEKLKEKDIQKAIKDFKEYFPEYDLSDIKALDYILWNNR